MSKEQKKKYIGEGDRHADKKEWDDAIEAYEAALEADPFDKAVHERIVRMYIGKRDIRGYKEAVSRYNQMKEALTKKNPPVPSAKTPPPSKPVFETLGLEEEDEQTESPPPKPFKAFELPPRRPPEPPPRTPQPPPREEPKEEPKRLTAKETPKPYTPAELLRKEPPKPPPVRDIPLSPKIERENPVRPPGKPLLEPKKPQPPQPESFTTPPSPPQKLAQNDTRTPVTDADIAEADARQLERQGKKDSASKAYIQAAKLWDQKGNKEKAGMAYERAFELSASQENAMEILNKLNEFYGQGVKLKQSTVMEIYRRIYHMKV